jgi:hypothetical protein
MKVEGRHESAPVRPASDKGRFQEMLKKSPPEAVKAPAQGGRAVRAPMASAREATGPLAPPGLARTPRRSAFANAEHLGQVRQGLTAEAHRLRDVRGEAHQMHQERVRQRVTDLIARELAREPRPEPPMPRSAPASPGPETPSSTPPVESSSSSAGGARPGGAGGAAALEMSNPEARVQAALELIEQIEVFVKSQRPALAMRLGGTLDATVEVERTGEHEVALRIQGRRGRFPQKDLARIRDALAERGLKLSAFLSA